MLRHISTRVAIDNQYCHFVLMCNFNFVKRKLFVLQKCNLPFGTNHNKNHNRTLRSSNENDDRNTKYLKKVIHIMDQTNATCVAIGFYCCAQV